MLGNVILPSSKKTYSLKINDEDLLYDEQAVSAAGDSCGFGALGLSREDGAAYFLSKGDDSAIREIVAYEIADQILSNNLPEEMADQYREKTDILVQAVNQSQAEIDEKARQIREVKKFSGTPEELLKQIGNPFNPFYEALNTLLKNNKVAVSKLHQFCSGSEIYCQFVFSYIAKDGNRLSYGYEDHPGLIDALAKIISRNIRIWKYVENYPELQCVHSIIGDEHSKEYTELFHHNMQNPHATVGQNHFSELVLSQKAASPGEKPNYNISESLCNFGISAHPVFDSKCISSTASEVVSLPSLAADSADERAGDDDYDLFGNCYSPMGTADSPEVI